MSDEIQLVRGHLPWAPSDHARLLQTFEFWDMPLAGLITEEGNDFAFLCLTGVTDDETLWAYAPIGESEIAELVRTADTLTVLRRLIASRFSWLALSREGDGIVETAVRSRDGKVFAQEQGEATERLLQLYHAAEAARQIA